MVILPPRLRTRIRLDSGARATVSLLVVSDAISTSWAGGKAPPALSPLDTAQLREGCALLRAVAQGERLACRSFRFGEHVARITLADGRTLVEWSPRPPAEPWPDALRVRFVDEHRHLQSEMLRLRTLMLVAA